MNFQPRDALMPQASFTDESIDAVGFASAMPMCYADGAVGGPGGPGSGYFDAWDGSNPINNGIIIILGGAGFCPSTVLCEYLEQDESQIERFTHTNLL